VVITIAFQVVLASMLGLKPVSSSRQDRQFDVYESPGIAGEFSALAVRPSKEELATIAVLCFLSSFWYPSILL